MKWVKAGDTWIRPLLGGKFNIWIHSEEEGRWITLVFGKLGTQIYTTPEEAMKAADKALIAICRDIIKEVSID